MSRTKKLMVIVAAPLTLASLLGGAVAFDSQSAGAVDGPSAGGYHRVTFGDGGTQDGSDCPHDKGSAAESASVSPSVY